MFIKCLKLNSLFYDRLLKNNFHVCGVIQNGFKHKNVTNSFIENLKCQLGSEKISTSPTLRSQCGTDESYHKGSPADIVVFPHCLEDIVSTTKLCSSSFVPIIPRGTGTGLEHGVGGLMGGVCIDLSKMTNIIEVNEDDFDCSVEPGVTRKTLNTHLRHTGLMFPVDPGADACLGGMAATSASGTNAIHYGTMKENILNLEVVLANGDILHTAGPDCRARKSAAGYNLTELFVGSEGTLGIISKITLRLHAVPEMIVSAVSSFPTVKNAVDTVVNVLQRSVPVARIEFLDELSVKVINKYCNSKYPSAPSLFFEFHGNDVSIKSQVDETEKIVNEHAGYNFKQASDMQERNKLWEGRHQIYYATRALKPGFKCLVTDVCVPISKLPEMVAVTQQDIAQSGLLGTIIGHVGDGNFHTQLLYDPQSEYEENIAHELEKTICLRAISLNGTCTGEHGIGIGKMSFLEREYGCVGMEVMKNIKRSLDPHGLMNPGKVVNLL